MKAAVAFGTGKWHVVQPDRPTHTACGQPTTYAVGPAEPARNIEPEFRCRSAACTGQWPAALHLVRAG